MSDKNLTEGSLGDQLRRPVKGESLYPDSEYWDRIHAFLKAKRVSIIPSCEQIVKECYEEHPVDPFEGCQEFDNELALGLGAALDEAKACITGARQDSYGAPEDSFTIIAGYWDTYLKHRSPGPLTPLDTAHMMTLFKIARCTGQAPCRDNYIDGAGYLAIAADRLIPATQEAPNA